MNIFFAVCIILLNEPILSQVREAHACSCPHDVKERVIHPTRPSLSGPVDAHRPILGTFNGRQIQKPFNQNHNGFSSLYYSSSSVGWNNIGNMVFTPHGLGYL